MFDNPIVILSVLALLPLIPAILLFKLLPGGNTEVEGPLAGLKVKLGGAFGGYVALTVFLATFYATSLKTTGTSMEDWTVVGDVAHSPGYEATTCKLSPPLSVDPGDSFEWHIPVPKGATLPNVTFEAPGYEGETLYLSNSEKHINKKFPVEIDAAKRIVRVKVPISLRKKNASPGLMAAGGL
jgi:hypothetical protein